MKDQAHPEKEMRAQKEETRNFVRMKANKLRTIIQSKDTSINTTPIIKPSQIYLRNNYEQVEQSSCSPTINGVSPPNFCHSPDTPDYCPIINAENRKDYIIRINSFDEITELPLDFEEDSNAHFKFNIQEICRTSKASIKNSPEKHVLNSSRSQRNLHMLSSEDSIGSKNMYINSETILKAFKNSPCSEMLFEYFKNKSKMEKKHEIIKSNSKTKL